MSDSTRILAFAGSLRRESYNKRLLKIAVRAAQEEGAEVTEIDLQDFRMPVLDQDMERAEGLPASARQLKKLMVDHDGFLIASPEYNSSVTGVLKNTIDWASRPAEGEPPLVAFQGKIAAIIAASPGGLGGLRGLVHLRAILGNIGVLVLPEQLAVPKAHEAFAEDGSLADGKLQGRVEQIGRRLVQVASRLRDPE